MSTATYLDRFRPRAQRVTKASDSDGRRVVYVRQQTAGVRVTEETALTFSAFWACLRIISEPIAGLPWRVLRELPTGRRERQVNNRVDFLLHDRANPEMSSATFRETLIPHALSWGNGYAEIERDFSGRPFWLWPITPDRVEVLRATEDLIEAENLDGVRKWDIIYRVWGSAGYDYIPAKDMFHLHGLGFDGLVGYSVVNIARRALGLGIAMDENASSFFGNGLRMSGMIKLPQGQRLKPEDRDTMRREWMQLHSGNRNAYKLGILDNGGDFVQLSMNNDDAQFLESRRFQISEMSRISLIPMHKLGELDRATHSNIEEQNIEFVGAALMPWIVRLEQEANWKLFGGPARSSSLYTKMNLNALLRGNAQQRAAFYQMMIDRGIFSINDVLELEDRDPIGPDGDKRFVPLNMTLLEKAGEEPEPPPPPPARPDGPQEPDEGDGEEDTEESPQDRTREGFYVMAREAWDRILKREEHRIEDARKRADAGKANFDEAMNSFYEQHREYMVSALRPIAEAVATVVDADAERLDTVIRLRTDKHCERRRLERLGIRDANWQACAFVDDLLTACTLQLGGKK